MSCLRTLELGLHTIETVIDFANFYPFNYTTCNETQIKLMEGAKVIDVYF